MNGLTAVPGARLLRLQGNSTDGYWQLSPPATPSSTIRRKHQRFDANYFIAPARGLLNTIRAEARKLDSPTNTNTTTYRLAWSAVVSGGPAIRESLRPPKMFCCTSIHPASPKTLLSDRLRTDFQMPIRRAGEQKSRAGFARFGPLAANQIFSHPSEW